MMRRTTKCNMTLFVLLVVCILSWIQPSTAQANAVKSQQRANVEVTLLFKMRRLEKFREVHSKLFEKVAMDFLAPQLESDEQFVELKDAIIISQTLQRKSTGDGVRHKNDIILFVELMTISDVNDLSAEALAQRLFGIFSEYSEALGDLLSENDLIIGDIMSVELTGYSSHELAVITSPPSLATHHDRINLTEIQLQPTASPTSVHPSSQPSNPTSMGPTIIPSSFSSLHPTISTSANPTSIPSFSVSLHPTTPPSAGQSSAPSNLASLGPTTTPSAYPSMIPTIFMSAHPTTSATLSPTLTSDVPSISAYQTLTPSDPASLGPTTKLFDNAISAPSLPLSLHPSISPSIPTNPVSLLPTTLPSMYPTSTPVLPVTSPSTILPLVSPSMTTAIPVSLHPTTSLSTYPSLATSITASEVTATTMPSTTAKPSQKETQHTSQPSPASSSQMPQEGLNVINLSTFPSLTPTGGNDIPAASEYFDINQYFRPTYEPSRDPTDSDTQATYRTYETRLRLELDGVTFRMQGGDIQMFEDVVKHFLSDYIPSIVTIVEVTFEDQIISGFDKRRLRLVSETQLKDPTRLIVQFIVRGHAYSEEDILFSDIVVQSFQENYNDFMERLKFSSPIFNGIIGYKNSTVQPSKKRFPVVPSIATAIIALTIFGVACAFYLHRRPRENCNDSLSLSTLSSASDTMNSSKLRGSAIKLPSTSDLSDVISMNQHGSYLSSPTASQVSGATDRDTFTNDRYSQEAEYCGDSLIANSHNDGGRSDRYEPLLTDIDACISSYVQKRYERMIQNERT